MAASPAHQCRFCSKQYVEKVNNREGRYNLFKNKNESSLAQQLKDDFNIYVPQITGLSDTVCRSCHANIKTLYKAKSIVVKWLKVLSMESNKKRPLEIEENTGERKRQKTVEPYKVQASIQYNKMYNITLTSPYDS